MDSNVYTYIHKFIYITYKLKETNDFTIIHYCYHKTTPSVFLQFSFCNYSRTAFFINGYMSTYTYD